MCNRGIKRNGKTKMKEFILMSGRVEGSGWAVRMRITRTGGFQSKGDISVMGKVRKSIIKRKNRRQRARRRRNFGFHMISYEHENCAWHHVNRNDVVAVPRLIHERFQHSLIDGSALKLEGVIG